MKTPPPWEIDRTVFSILTKPAYTILSTYWPRAPSPADPVNDKSTPCGVTVSVQIRFFPSLHWMPQETEWDHMFPFDSHPNTAKHRVCASFFKLCVCVKHRQTLDWNADTVSQLWGTPFKSFSFLFLNLDLLFELGLRRDSGNDYFTMILQRTVKCVSSKTGDSPSCNRPPSGTKNLPLALSF